MDEKQPSRTGRWEFRDDLPAAVWNSCGQNFTTKIAGDDSLNRRPMKRILTPLREMGAKSWRAMKNFAPLEIRGGKLRAFTTKLPMASAQVKSAVLLPIVAGGYQRPRTGSHARSHGTGA